MKAPAGGRRLLTMKKPVGPCLFVTAVELPARDGHPQDRAGRRGRLHDGRQARLADAAHDARAGRHPRRGGPAGRRAQRRADHRRRRGQQDAPGRRAAAQGELHRLDRGRPQARRASRPSSCSGSAWSSAATPRSSCSPTPTSTPPSTARCSPRCATWGRPARPPTGSSCTPTWPRSSAAGSPSGWARSPSAAARTTASTSVRSSTSGRSESVSQLVTDAVHDGAKVLVGGERRRRARLLLPAHGAGRRAGGGRRSTSRRSSGRSRRSPRSRPRRRRSPPPTTPSTGCRRTSSPATSPARCGWPSGSSSAWSASTPAWSPTPAAPFGGVKASGFGREGGFEGIEEYLETTYLNLAAGD